MLKKHFVLLPILITAIQLYPGRAQQGGTRTPPRPSPGVRNSPSSEHDRRRGFNDPNSRALQQLGERDLIGVGGKGGFVSQTSLAAPKKARKAFHKARKLIANANLDEAERQLSRAVEIYPQYAVAWEQLGEVHRRNPTVSARAIT